MSQEAVTQIDLQGALKRIASGKVRDLFEVDENTLLFVATDRISAYDVIMENGVPKKGALLTKMSIFWFNELSKKVDGLQTHLVSTELPSSVTNTLSADQVEFLKDRSMQVKRLKPFALESIVRGYITGSAWKEYQQKGTVHGIEVKSDKPLQEGDKFPTPLWTPSTKAELGDKDENIHPDQAKKIVGDEYATEIERVSVALYTAAHEYALTKGIIIADTKFEFAPAPGSTPENPQVVLIDEVLTPDSSRFWPLAEYKPGATPPSYDKQYLRDWLVANKLKGKKGVKMPDDVVQNTSHKYTEAYDVLTSS